MAFENLKAALFGAASHNGKERKMDFRRVSPDFAVTGQIRLDDIPAIAAAGFKTVICNRPDNEMGAVPHRDVEAAARAAGLGFKYVPVAGGVTEQNVRDMQSALDSMQGPMLGYCRSGARSTTLYSVAQQMKQRA